jgi:hypothetical protein
MLIALGFGALVLIEIVILVVLVVRWRRQAGREE